MGYQRWTEGEAREALARWGRSGRSLLDWAKRERIEYSRLCRWKRRLGTGDEAALKLTAVDIPRPAGVPGTAGVLEIALSPGIVVRVPAGFDAGELRRLLEALSC